MGISVDTVSRTMDWAREANIFVDYEQRLFDELLPLAHEAVKLALQDGDAHIAIKVMEGIRLLNKSAPKSGAAQTQEEGLYEAIARARAGLIVNVTPEPRQFGPAPQSPGTTPLPVLDGVHDGGVYWDEAHPTGESPNGPETPHAPVEG